MIRRFARNRMAFIKNAVRLSPLIPIRETIAAGREVMQSRMIRVVSDSGRWTTGTAIPAASTSSFDYISDLKHPAHKCASLHKIAWDQGGLLFFRIAHGCASPAFITIWFSAASSEFSV